MRRRSGSWAPNPPRARREGCGRRAATPRPPRPGRRRRQGDPPGAQGLHLAALEGEPALVGLEDVVVVAGAAVAGDGPVRSVAAVGRRAAVVRSFAAATRATYRRSTRPPGPLSWGDGHRYLGGDAPAAGRCLRRDRRPLPARAARRGVRSARWRPGLGRRGPAYPTRNVAASAKLYTVDPGEHLRADRDAEARGPRSSACSTPTPTPTPTPRPPTSPRLPTRDGTTCSCRSATPIPCCGPSASRGAGRGGAGGGPHPLVPRPAERPERAQSAKST